MNRRYDVLLCDADDTLFDFKKEEENAFAEICAAASLGDPHALLPVYSRINAELWRLLERGGITQSALRTRRFEIFLREIGRGELDAHQMGLDFADALSRQGVLLPGALDAVQRWSRVLPVIVVTNGIARVQHGRMERCEVRHFISGMVISEEVGAAKPDPRMLRIAMEQAGVGDVRRALMLGNSLTSDIAAAYHAGVDACWFNPQGRENDRGLPVRYEIRSLDEVDAILIGEYM